MGFAKSVKNIVTFGASGRVDNKLEEFYKLKSNYENLYFKMENKRQQVNKTLEKLIDVKVECVNSLRKIPQLSKNLQGKERNFLSNKIGNEVELVDLTRVKNIITVADMALNASKGISVGVGSAVGAWALVSTFGTASTGTAIVTLSGAAATNATLAWLGGGAIAAGGGGMVVGTFVLGGIVAIPALIIAGVFSHIKASKQISEIEEKMNEVIEAQDAILSNLAKLDVLDRRSIELIESLTKEKEVFDAQFKIVYQKIYPSVFSKLFKSIRKYILRKKYFSPQDLTQISYIGGLATSFAILVDTTPIEEC